MKKMLMFGIIFVCILLCIKLVTCIGRKHAYFQGQILYIDGEEYEETSGFYKESNTVISRTDNGFTIYEVVGDPEHNYVVARSFLDNYLHVKKNYAVDKTAIEGYFFELGYGDFISGKEIIDIMKTLSESKEKVDIDNDLLMSGGNGEKKVYIKYYNDPVGKYCGGIIFDGKDYVYYNWDKKEAVLISKEILEKLRELGVFS